MKLNWILDWYKVQEQMERLEDWYKNHEMDNGIKNKLKEN